MRSVKRPGAFAQDRLAVLDNSEGRHDLAGRQLPQLRFGGIIATARRISGVLQAKITAGPSDSRSVRPDGTQVRR